jgi:hypothetical protein
MGGVQMDGNSIWIVGCGLILICISLGFFSKRGEEKEVDVIKNKIGKLHAETQIRIEKKFQKNSTEQRVYKMKAERLLQRCEQVSSSKRLEYVLEEYCELIRDLGNEKRIDA